MVRGRPNPREIWFVGAPTHERLAPLLVGVVLANASVRESS